MDDFEKISLITGAEDVLDALIKFTSDNCGKFPLTPELSVEMMKIALLQKQNEHLHYMCDLMIEIKRALSDISSSIVYGI